MYLPTPRDIPLPLPAASSLLESLLTISFVAHLAFVNLMVGSTLLVLGFQYRGRHTPGYARLARALATTVTVNKSLAVVLGVAPLLLINVLYTVQFYTANALTGTAWILLIPTIALAFLLLYLHKYTWERWAHRPRLHLATLAVAAVLLLFVPLVFLANTTLMMMPERWDQVAGFWSTLALPSLLPRYAHFLNASLVISSLFGLWYFGSGPRVPEGLTAPQVRRAFYGVALVASLAQFVVGPVVLLTLPSRGLTRFTVIPVVLGAALALPAVGLMWRERRAAQASRWALAAIGALLAVAVLLMGIGRHAYRLAMLAEHRVEVARATEAWQTASAEAAREARESAAGIAPGQRLFEENCAACHAVAQRLVGPPLTEIATLYQGRPDGVVTWARAPGRRRADYPPMPPFASLGDAKLRAIATYMLELGGAPSTP